METVERLGITLERAKRIQKSLLNQIQARCTQVHYLIAMEMMIRNMVLVMPRDFESLGGLSHSVVEYVIR